MSVQPVGTGGAAERRSATGLADVIDSILDKGLVIDAYASVSLVGIELLTVNARVVVASVDTYLRFAEAVNRLDLTESSGTSLPDLVGEVSKGDVSKGAVAGKGAVQGALQAAADKLGDVTGGSGESQEAPAGRKGEG